MNKLSKIAAAVLTVAALGTTANAVAVTGNVAATVTVIPALTATPTNTLDFGTAVQGDVTPITIATPAACDLATATTDKVGAMQITNAAAGLAVTITTVYNDLTDGTTTIPFTAGSVSYCDADAGTLTDVTTDGTIVNLVADGVANENTFYVAGTITPTGAEAAATFSSTMDVTLTY